MAGPVVPTRRAGLRPCDQGARGGCREASYRGRETGEGYQDALDPALRAEEKGHQVGFFKLPGRQSDSDLIIDHGTEQISAPAFRQYALNVRNVGPGMALGFEFVRYA